MNIRAALLVFLVLALACTLAGAAPAMPGHLDVANAGHQMRPRQAAGHSSIVVQGSAGININIGLTHQQADQMLCLINQRRAREKLPPLAIHPDLMKSAQAHSDYQASIGAMTHADPNGSIISRISKYGFKWSSAAENVAMRQKSVVEVVDDWFKSKVHLDNILSNNAYVGFGFRNGAWTQHFATPPKYKGKNNAQPPPSQCPGLSAQISANIQLKGVLNLDFVGNAVNKIAHILN